MEFFDLFGSKKKKEDKTMASNEAWARALLDRYDKNELDDATLLKELGKYEFFYTTPFGDTREGTQKFFLLPGPEPTAYMPIFLNEKEMKDFYDNAGRSAFLSLKGTLLNLLEICMSENQKDKLNFKYGLIIDPIKYKITVDSSALLIVMGMVGGLNVRIEK